MTEPIIQHGETEATGKILAHLDSLGIAYEKLEHEPVTTSEAAAGARASRLEEGAKALVVKAKDDYYHLIISAAARLDSKKLRHIIGSRKLRFATAQEVFRLTGCRPGAVPPLGNLFGLPVYMDSLLLAEDTVYFNCGSHTVSLRMARQDLQTAAEAEVADFHKD